MRPGHKSALRDPSVELDVSGKAISDEGFEEVVEALAQTIPHTEDSGQILRLEEASFKGNELTATSLGLLAPIIKLSAETIRDIDLANNRIEVCTVEDARNWEQFLVAVDGCCVVRRLDLSGNSLRSKAYELLSKVYAMENHTGGRGLHTVPYLILSETGIDDISALHLSYVIPKHEFPEQLLPGVPPSKPGPQTQLLETYDAVQGCRGIVYRPNEELGAAGNRVLELAEHARDSTHRNTTPAYEGASTPAVAMKDLSLSDGSRQPKTPDASRRRSSTGGASAYSPASRLCEIDRARSRIQGDALRDGGLTSNDLWWASMRMLKYARIILLQKTPIRTDWVAHAVNTPVKRITSSDLRGSATPLRISNTSAAAFSQDAFPRLPSSGISSPAVTKRPLANSNPNALISSRNTTPRRDSASSSKGLITFHNGPLNRVRAEEVPLPPSPAASQSDDEWRTTVVLPREFPEGVWTRILAHTAGADGILSSAQQRAVVRWAMDKSTLNEEMGALGKTEQQQIWKVLNGMKCLAYDDN